eukprot:ANDGO_07861.mRNA.1 Charged multivesicular body protein 6
MGFFFSKHTGHSEKPPQEDRITAHDRAVLDLKIQRDKLVQYSKKLEISIRKEVDIARNLLAQRTETSKSRAMLVIRKKKFQEGLLDKADAQLVNVEQMIASVEFALVEQSVFEGLKIGAGMLKQLQSEISLEKVDMLNEETADAISYQKQLAEQLAEDLDPEQNEQVNEELASLQRDLLGTKLDTVSVPQKDLPKPDTDRLDDAEHGESDEPPKENKRERERERVPMSS